MALYSQYISGTQFTAGVIVGSELGTSGLNPIVDELNSVIDMDRCLIYKSNVTGSKIADRFITFGSVAYDSNSLANANNIRIDIKKSGYYHVFGNCRFDPGNASGAAYLQLMKSGPTTGSQIICLNGGFVDATNFTYPQPATSTVDFLTSGQFIFAESSALGTHTYVFAQEGVSQLGISQLQTGSP